ncbi:hypothetical protein LVD15_05005 [Fulvivirga maritima]|uniref:hypothetical protein n=1 Tax=Fulvivirga maritima TaxID=2904247 RepID=UPI001F1CB1C3|nr:hypothetical protein [Fulvivirga maritima]UII27783.1 hypothetical protein LVD15_05005 [Fulvivirga maritima]
MKGILLPSLNLASKWADKVIIYDNESTNGTWGNVKELALSNSKIVPFKHDNEPYADGVRAEIFNSFKNEWVDGDWWGIQDSDEIYRGNPRKFISEQIGCFHYINGKKVDFSFDLNKTEDIRFTGDFEVDLKHITHFSPYAWSEPRMIKHRKNLKWEKDKIWPTHMGIVCENTIEIKHYPLRSANQIHLRWLTRRKTKERGGQYFQHWEQETWQEYYLKKAEGLEAFDSVNRVFENVCFANNPKQSYVKKLVKYILHGLRILP